MAERMMVTCPGCDGVVSVSPTGTAAEVRCLKCDEMVYTRSAEGGEWWANVLVADPTAEKPVAVPVAAEKVDVSEVVATTSIGNPPPPPNQRMLELQKARDSLKMYRVRTSDHGWLWVLLVIIAVFRLFNL